MGILGRLFASNGWNRFPRTFAAGLERRLGETNFQTLTALAEKYGFFEQQLFSNPKALDIDDELTRTQVAALVTSMGNALMRDQVVEDAEKAFNVALCLLPEHFTARGSLATICYYTGRTDEARQHAARAVADMDKHKERFKNIPVPEHIAPQEVLDDYRNLLVRIAAGEAIEKAAEQGDANAQYNLGWMYREGRGVPQDYIEAVKWYTKVAEQGDASAQFHLGWMYYEGEELPQDYREAAKWITKAAEQGDAKARIQLGRMYLEGKGVLEDYVKAYKWALLAAMNGTDAANEFKEFAGRLQEILREGMTLSQVEDAQREAEEFLAQQEQRLKGDRQAPETMTSTPAAF